MAKPDIEGGTEEALMRRSDEPGLAPELPMTAVLAVEFAQLAEQLADLPDEVNGVLRNFDGLRTLREAVELSPLDEPSALLVVRRLMESGVVREVTRAQEKLHLVRFPPLRGVRRERLRREAEEARLRIGERKAVRLSRVVELPAYLPGGADALGDARSMSPAVSEAARKFAPDAEVARLVGIAAEVTVRTRPEAEPVPTPPIAPVADATPAPPAAEPTIPKRPWGWYGAGAAALLAAAFLLRPEPRTEKKDAPWVPPAPVEPVAPPQPKAVEPPVAQSSAPAAAPASDLLYKKALEQGDALLRRGKYKQAISRFQQAVRERPQAVPALLALGDAYLEADKPRSAVEPLETAARLDPRSGRAQLLLGTAYQSLGRNAPALTAYRRYLELEPQGEFARDVRVILANLSR